PLSRGISGSADAAWLVRRVLRLELLAADLPHGVVGRDRGLAHADRDQGDLAGIAGDVARRVDAVHARPAARRVDLDLALALELDAPVRDLAEGRDEAEQGDERVAVDRLHRLLGRVLDRHGLDRPVAVHLANLGGREYPGGALPRHAPRLVSP